MDDGTDVIVLTVKSTWDGGSLSDSLVIDAVLRFVVPKVESWGVIELRIGLVGAGRDV